MLDTDHFTLGLVHISTVKMDAKFEILSLYYSTDEEEPVEAKQKQVVDPKTLTWLPWMVYHSWLAGSSFFQYCDSWGESLAWYVLESLADKKYFEISVRLIGLFCSPPFLMATFTPKQ